MGKVIYQLILASLCVIVIPAVCWNKQTKTTTSLVNGSSGEFVADSMGITPEINKKILIRNTGIKAHIINAAKNGEYKIL